MAGVKKSSRMKMAALCQRANLSRSTVYQYLKAGILHPPIKEGPTQLKYDETHLARLNEIKHLRKQKKLSIPEIIKELQSIVPENAYVPDKADEPSTLELKDLIATKALEFFSKYGFSKTKITDITESLNLGKGTFYLYYKSKEDLFLECIKRVPESILPEHYWHEIRQEQDYFKRAKKRTSIMLKTFPTFAGIINVAKLALRGDDPNLAKKATECFQTINRAIAKDITNAIKKGHLRQVEEEFYAFISFGMVEAVGYWLLMNPNARVEEYADKIADFIHYGVIPRDENTDRYSTRPATLNWRVEDSSGTTVGLANFRLDNKPYLEGNLGEGTLRIELGRIANFKINKQAEHHFACVTMKTNETISIQIDKAITLTGDSSFGNYEIPIAEIDSVATITS